MTKNPNWTWTQQKNCKNKYIWVVKYYKLDIVKFSSPKRLFKSSRWVIQLYGLSCSNFNRTVPLTVKNKNIFLLICSFFAFVPKSPKRHKLSIRNSRAPSGKFISVGFRSFKSFLTLIICSRSFLQGNFAIVRSLVEAVARFYFLITNINCYMLQNFARHFLKFAMYNCVRYAYNLYTVHSQTLCILKHWHSREATYYSRASFTFLPHPLSDSSVLKLVFKFPISSVNLDILLVCLCIWRNKSITWRLCQRFEIVFNANSCHNVSRIIATE